ncbi:hypothetical protein LJC46_03465 [Desulfovibrio sp. OttesenSCG-928-G15]|nr:hypothetical protein [Desulfovibrio sp. OttesenSCG-928-G15]
MRTYPLSSLSLEEAKALQFRIVDTVTRHFDGVEVLSLGDLGLGGGGNKPVCTSKVEKVFAGVFDAEAALLLRGSGTGAIRFGLQAMLGPGGCLLVHDAPIYPTTKASIESMGIRTISADFNRKDAVQRVLGEAGDSIQGILVQHARQKPDDSYDFAETLRLLKSLRPDIPLLTDDNYTALKTPCLGCQAGAELSSFSCFKTLGPEGVGVLLGKKEFVRRAAGLQYSGGSQIQGHEAMAALRGLIYAPVALAIQAEVTEELVRRLCGGEVPGVSGAFVANAQSKVLLVELEEAIAEDVLRLAPGFGAAAYPVGSESKYEFVPMMYRISGTFRQQDPELEKRMLRINPMRAGADTVIRILRQAIAGAAAGAKTGTSVAGRS